MKPDELPPPQYSVVKSESRVVRQYSPQQPQIHGGFRPMYSSISRVEHLEPEVVVSSHENPTTAEQNFFPSFFRSPPVNAHSRPYQTATSPNVAAASIAGRYTAGRSQNFDRSILGSGDFQVLRGGTFYPEGERSFKIKGTDEFLASFLNGHGRPNAQAQTSSKEAYYPEDPFENFKDFADLSNINAGSDPAFSHFVVVYANKNSTQPHPSHPSPKNIFEQLQLLDLEKEKEKSSTTTEQPSEKAVYDKKLMKLSKFKTKLAKTKVVKKYKKKLGPKVDQSPDYTDPLLALS